MTIQQKIIKALAKAFHKAPTPNNAKLLHEAIQSIYRGNQ